MPQDDTLYIEGCPAPVHSPAIVSRCGGPPASVMNVCGHCGSSIVRVDGAVWAAVPERDADRVRAHYA